MVFPQVVCILIALLSSSTFGINPGFKARLSKAGLNYANKIALDILTKDVQGKPISDQHGSQKVSGFHVDYDLTGMSIRSFTRPSASVVLNPGTGATWRASGASLSAGGHWHYKAKKSFIKWSDSGSFDLSVNGLQFSLSVSMGVDAHGRPTIQAPTCSADAGSVDVKFHGGASWLYNLFRSYVERSLKDQLKSLLCSAAKKAINVDAQKSLSTLDVVTRLGSDLSLDYSLLEKPTFLSDALETSHKGEIFFTAARKSVPFQAPPVPASTTGRMMTAWLSDYIVNTAGYAAQTNNLLRYNLTSKDLAPEDRVFLNTSCAIGYNCFGKLIPIIQKLYPNRHVELDMYSTTPPKVKVTPGSINLTFGGNLEVRLEHGSRTFLFSANATMTTNVRVYIENNLLKASVQNTSIAVDILKASITKHIKTLQRALKFAMKYASNDFIDQQLNDLGQKGIKVPVVSGVQFVNSTLTLVQDAIRLETDVKYIPSSTAGVTKTHVVASPPQASKNLKFAAKKYHKILSHVHNDVMKAMKVLPRKFRHWG